LWPFDRGSARATLFSLVAALATLCGSAAAQSPAEFKSISIVVGSSPGGGYDTYARMLARHLGRHLPSQPSIIVQNMPGASSLKAVQYLDSGAPKDGSVIAAFNPGLITESLLNPERIKLRFSDLAWIGSITRDLRACYAWGASGIKSWADLKGAKRFNMGAPAPGTSSFINAAVLKHLFGIAVHQVTGYAGSAEQRLAIERGELDGDCGAWSSVPPDWISGRKINPLVKFTPLAVPGLPSGVPYVGEFANNKQARDVLDLLTTPDALGRPFVASKQAPANRMAVLRAGFERTMADPQFLADAEKLDLPVSSPISGNEAQMMIEDFYAASPSLVARAQEIVGR
jgi:tripartite-type tricarboxylate transporter receptor subunit TctC